MVLFCMCSCISRAIIFLQQINSFQAILITDGVYSYTIFTYKCGLMEWGSSPTIGYNAAGESYANHDPSSPAIACLNSPDSDYYNVIYLLSNESPEFALPRKLLNAYVYLSVKSRFLHLSLQKM